MSTSPAALSLRRAHRRGAAALPALALATLAALAVPAHADTFELTAQITQFRSWIFPNNANLNAQVNGTALVDSGVAAGTYQGQSFDWSNWVSFGLGTLSVDFGYDPALLPSRRINTFSVATVTPTVTLPPPGNSPFDLARLTFTNGQWFYRAEVDMRFVAHDVQTGVDHLYFDTALVTSNASTAIGIDPSGLPIFDPTAEADMFVLNQHPEFGSVRVYEAVAQPPGNPGSTGSAVLRAHIGSLDPVGFTAAQGGAFLDPSVTATPSHIPAVPEPSPSAMWLSGLLALAGVVAVRARRRTG